MNSGYTYREQVPQRGAGRGLAVFLAERHPHSSAPIWGERIGRGEVLLDGAAPQPDQRLRAGQTIAWSRPPWEEPQVDTRFEVLFEDAFLLAVAKPRGLPTVPGGGEFLENTLLSLVRKRTPSASPMHRLGRSTSGIVLFALTPRARSIVQQAFREGRMRKTYRALVQGAPPARLLIDTPIGPVLHPLLGTVHAASPTGKASHSAARLLEQRQGCALVEVEIATGRPHQIRIHLAAAGYPLIGDPLYLAGGGVSASLPGDPGYLLHAWRLGLAHPTSGAALELISRPPVELATQGE